MALSVRLDRQTEADLRAIRDYLTDNAGIEIAEQVRRHLYTRIERLRDAPYIGVMTTHPEIRLLPPTRYPYRIYYTLTEDAVVILHIRHSARRDPDPAVIGG
jgi:plasmid stabilization system protein ParE